jgi:hypothetical protein
MATSVGDILRSSMRKVGILAAGEPIPDEDANDGLEVFEQMIDAWSNETLLIPVVNVVTFGLSANQPEYTIGSYPTAGPFPTNHIETARPERILSSFIRDGSGTDYPQEQIVVDTFSRISRKTNASRPSRFYLRNGWPLNTILFESTPYADETLHLEVVQPLSGILPVATLTEVVNLPPGYKRTIINNLAMELAPEWGKDIPQMVAVAATDGKRWLKRNNHRSLVLVADRALTSMNSSGRGTFDIESGV